MTFQIRLPNRLAQGLALIKQVLAKHADNFELIKLWSFFILRFPGVRDVLVWLLVVPPSDATHPCPLVYGMRILLLQCRRQETGQRLRPVRTLPTNLQVQTQLGKPLELIFMRRLSARSTFFDSKKSFSTEMRKTEEGRLHDSAPWLLVAAGWGEFMQLYDTMHTMMKSTSLFQIDPAPVALCNPPWRLSRLAARRSLIGAVRKLRPAASPIVAKP